MWEIALREVVQVQGKFSYQGYKETKEIFVLCASNKPTNIYQKPLQCKKSLQKESGGIKLILSLVNFITFFACH